MSLAAGIDLCHDNGTVRWEIESDANVIRNLESGEGQKSLVERLEVEGAYRSQFREEWHWGSIVVGQADQAGGLQSRFLGGAGLGFTRSRDWGNYKLEGGIAFTYEDNEKAFSDSFTETWFRSKFQWRVRKNMVLLEKFEVFGRISDLSDYRLDSETDLVLRFDDRLSVKMGVELKWDEEPARDFDELDVTAQMALVFSWGSAE